MNAAAKLEPATDPMATVRALKRMRYAGFDIAVRDGRLTGFGDQWNRKPG